MKQDGGPANSGIQIRSATDPKYNEGRVFGLQVDIDSPERDWSGTIYDEQRRGWLYPGSLNPNGRGLYKMGEWNQFRIEAIGPTWFYPDKFTERDPVELVNARIGIESESWSATVWAKNLTDEEYNAEWSPGPQFFPNPGYTNNFVFKALPRRWGVDLTYRF